MLKKIKNNISKFFTEKTISFYVLLNSFILVLLFNVDIIVDRFFISNYFYFVYEIILHISIISLLLFIVSFSHRLYKVFLIILYFLSTIYLYSLLKFGVVIDDAFIANAIDSTGHIEEILDYSVVFYALLFLFFAILIYKIRPYKIKILRKGFYIILCLLVISANQFLLPHKGGNIAIILYSPVNYIISTTKYITRFKKTLEISKKRVSLEKIYGFKKIKKQNIDIIIIIGESLRADHLPKNGYQRNTTPYISANKNILNFVTTASYNYTSHSVSSFLSHRNKKDIKIIPTEEKSLISVFKNLGYNTAWYSAQSSAGNIASILLHNASEADEYWFRDRLRKDVSSGKRLYDKKLLPYLKESLKKSGNLIVMHSFGNHIKFFERYPKEYEKYKPVCLKKNMANCSKEGLINSYDNSILYVDSFIKETIKIIKNKKAILFFVGDHGVHLGENGVYANGSSSTIGSKVHEVPTFLYMSPKLLKDNFYKQKYLSAKYNQKKKISHDNIFDSILDCSGIKSSLFYTRKQSICSKLD